VRSAVTYVEVLTVVAIVLLLLAMLIPGLGSAREQVRRVLCRNNLREWGRACWCYRNDYHDFIPLEGTYLVTAEYPEPLKKPYSWFNVLPPYLGAPPYAEVEGANKKIKDYPALHVWICPSKNLSKLYKSGPGKNQFHYAMNQGLDGVGVPQDTLKPVKAERFAANPYTVFMFDVYSNQPGGTQKDVATSFHRNRANVLYLDGAVDEFKAEDFVVDGDYDRAERIWNHPRLNWGYLPDGDATSGE